MNAASCSPSIILSWLDTADTLVFVTASLRGTADPWAFSKYVSLCSAPSPPRSHVLERLSLSFLSFFWRRLGSFESFLWTTVSKARPYFLWNLAILLLLSSIRNTDLFFFNILNAKDYKFVSQSLLIPSCWPHPLPFLFASVFSQLAPTGVGPHWPLLLFILALPFKSFLLFMHKLKCRNPSVAMAVMLLWAFGGLEL